MSLKLTRAPRHFMGRGSDDVMAMPNLVEIQISSYERLLQREQMSAGKPPDRYGLEEVFRNVFPIESPNACLLYTSDAADE